MRMKDRLGINNLVGVCQPAEGYNKKVVKAVTNVFTGGDQKAAAKRAERLAQQEQKLREQEKKARDRMAAVEAARARTKQMREARIQRAQLLAQGAGMGLGVEGTSPLTGALGSISSQLASNVAAVNMQQTAGLTLGNLQSQQASLQAQQQSQFNKIQSFDRRDSGIMSIFKIATSFA